MLRNFLAFAAITITSFSVSPVLAADGDTDCIALDRMAIEMTLQRYVRALDNSDLDAYLATLTTG